MTDLWTEKVTIYNDIPAIDTEPRRFERFVIDRCQIQGQLVDKANDTVRKVVNAQTVITKDVKHYKSPAEYMVLASNQREGFYTVQVGDFVVFGKVYDAVTNAQEFAKLQTKYKNNGMKVTAVSSCVNGMTVDNVTMTNA